MLLTTNSLFEDDSLWLVSLLAVDSLKLKFTKILLRSTLIFHLILWVIQIFFQFCIFDFDDFIKFGPEFFAMFYVMVNIIALLCDGNSVDRIMLEFKPWALDSAGKELSQKIKKEAMRTSIVIIVNSLIALLLSVLFFLPAENDEELFFALYLFKRWFPVYGFVLSWIYRSTFFVLAYVLITP
ncbi:unnamed protein product, partial [Tenebrio molitor]